MECNQRWRHTHKCELTQAHRLGYVIQCKPPLLLLTCAFHFQNQQLALVFLMFIYCVCVWLGMVVLHMHGVPEVRGYL